LQHFVDGCNAFSSELHGRRKCFLYKKREARTFDFAIFKSQAPWVQGHPKESTQPRTYGLDSSDTLQVSFTRSLRINCLLENRQRQLLMLTEKMFAPLRF
jgi:hypothetical protein